MIISIKHEMIVFWSAFLCGQVVFFLFDFFRALRKSIKHSKAMVAAEDTLFCLIAFKIFFDMLHATNNGHIRWYIPASLISGLVIYFFVLSKYLIKLWEFLIKVFKVVLSPFLKLLKLFKRVIFNITKVGKTWILSVFGFSLGKFRQIATKKPNNPHKTKV